VSRPEILWSLLVIAAALIGGLAGTALVRVSLAVSVGVGGGVIVALAAARRPSRSADQPQARPTAPGGPVGGQHAESDGQTSADAVVQLLPISPTEDWRDTSPGTPPVPDLAAERDPVPNLSDYLASSVIAQCPNCGAFRLGIDAASDSWKFRCESCQYTWTWRPGTSWPPIRLAPGRRRQLYGNERQRPCMREISAARIQAAWCSCSTGPIL
jgi:hypothetical protein